jgi:hypothetical protein
MITNGIFPEGFKPGFQVGSGGAYLLRFLNHSVLNWLQSLEKKRIQKARQLAFF